MVMSYVNWYIAAGRTGGVIAFLWFFNFVEYYWVIKYPRFLAATVITVVTQLLIVDYELQARKLGEARAESSGQKFYPYVTKSTYLRPAQALTIPNSRIYELAPYRLATVVAGCGIAFLWTIFPAPTTERTWLRRDLSNALYLLANYFSVINQTIKTKLRDEMQAGDPDNPDSAAYRLRVARSRLYGKLMMLLPFLKEHTEFQKWEPDLGGKFPRTTYEEIIQRCGR